MLDLTTTDTNAAAGQYLSRLTMVLQCIPGAPLARMVELLLATRRTGHRVYVMGNGGSAATASHFVCDLVKTARVSGHQPLRVFALTDNTPLLTAWSNDAAYERSFADQIIALVEPGDVVIAISASGNSANVVAGLDAAIERGAQTIALVGFDGGRAGQLVDIAIHVPCHDYGLVEDTHAAIGHAVTMAIREALQMQPEL